MEIGSAFILFGAGLLAGAMNAAAGGGSFVTIPAMVSAGLPSVAANASSTVTLLPGTLASAWAWRRDFRPFEGVPIRTLLFISLGGGLVEPKGARQPQIRVGQPRPGRPPDRAARPPVRPVRRWCPRQNTRRVRPARPPPPCAGASIRGTPRGQRALP